MWIFAVFIGSAIVVLAPFIGRRWLQEDSSWAGLTCILTLIIGGTVLMVVATINAYTPGQHAIWWVLVGLFLATFIGHFCVCLLIDNEHILAWLVIFIALLVVTTTATVKALDDNSYNVTNGVVVRQNYTPGYFTPMTCTGQPIICSGNQYMPPQWDLTLRNCTQEKDKCVEGTLHFGEDVHGRYPVGSHYPAK